MRRKMPAVLTTVVAVVVIQLTMSLISIVLLLLLTRYQCFNNYNLFYLNINLKWKVDVTKPTSQQFWNPLYVGIQSSKSKER